MSLSFVIPGRREAANPESIITDRGYGFRARAVGASRNDELLNQRALSLTDSHGITRTSGGT
jgi:hypothetical protein